MPRAKKLNPDGSATFKSLMPAKPASRTMQYDYLVKATLLRIARSNDIDVRAVIGSRFDRRDLIALLVIKEYGYDVAAMTFSATFTKWLVGRQWFIKLQQASTLGNLGDDVKWFVEVLRPAMIHFSKAHDGKISVSQTLLNALK